MSTTAVERPGAEERAPDGWRSVLDVVADVVAQRPDALAATSPDAAWTYAALWEGAGRVADHLRALGVAPGDAVACELDRSADSVVVQLGVLRAGAAWVPLDPEQPAARREQVVRRGACAAVLAQPGAAGGRADHGAVRTSTVAAALAAAPTAAPAAVPTQAGPAARGPVPTPRPSSRAYVFFTSGSTGEPKGVEVSHGALAALLRWAAAALGPEDLRRTAACTTFTFDPSVLDVMATLCAGGTVDVLRSALDPRLPGSGATFLTTTPSVLRELVRARRLPDGVRTVVVGGEVLDAAVVREFLAARPGARLLQAYGPTEATVLVTAQELRDGATEVTLGRELPGVRAVVLDGELRPVADGEPGELCVAGEQVALGYAGDPVATARRFVAWTAPDGERLRLYRTGDRVRRRPDGDLQFLGRLDRQVKVRGHRVELEEVERALRAVDGVAEAVAAVDGSGADARLVAWVVPDAGAGAGGDAVRAAALDGVRAALPAYMVPSVLAAVDRLPVTAAGKADERALLASLRAAPAAAPAPTAPAPTASPAPAEGPGATAEVARAVAEVLRLPAPPHPDELLLSDLGGTSLQLLEVVGRVEAATGRRLDPAVALSDASVGDLAAALAAAAPSAPEQPRRGRWWRRGVSGR